ncbi:MAG: hypothetical protein Q8M08_16095 [Bacteroidales bacterium]|nr:hypothetical protein [Bacteroidales bacterium]
MLRIGPDIYDALEKWAADEFRSVNGQLEWVIEKALNEAKRIPKKRSNPTRKDEDLNEKS